MFSCVLLCYHPLFFLFLLSSLVEKTVSPTLISYSIRPSRSVVTALRLYKFYIIFMRHKVVEKPTVKKKKRNILREGMNVCERDEKKMWTKRSGFLGGGRSERKGRKIILCDGSRGWAERWIFIPLFVCVWGRWKWGWIWGRDCGGRQWRYSEG